MLNVTGYATIWQPENKGKYTTANISTSKKDKDGNYNNMSWKARFVGKNQDIHERMRIKITSGAIEVRKYEEKYYYDVVVFEWEEVAKRGSSGFAFDEGFTEIENDSELPF
jgi:hypothetical protein